MSNLIDDINVYGEKALGIEVEYGKGDPSEKNNKTNKWMKIIKCCDESLIGSLVKVSSRHCIEHEIELEYYYEFDSRQIALIIKKEDVKESLFEGRRP